MTRRTAAPLDIWKLPLRQQALKREELRHSIRLRELKSIDKMLALLEVEHAAIKEAGYEISGVEVSAGVETGYLHLMPHALFSGVPRAYRALLAAGFVEVKRSEGPYAKVYLKKGRLKIEMSISSTDLAMEDQRAASAPAKETA